MIRFYKIFFIFIFLGLTACNSDEKIIQGYVEGDYVYVASAVSGNLTKKMVERGDRVVVDQPLFVLDPQPETSKLAQAESQMRRAKQQLLDAQKGARYTVIDNIQAQLEQAQAGLSLAAENFKRYRTLYSSAVIDKAKFDEAKAQYKKNLQAVKAVEAKLAEAELGARENQISAQKEVLDAAKASAEQAKWALLQKSVRSVSNAQVFDVLYEKGEFVLAGQPVVVLLPPENIKVVFFVSEDAISQIAVGEDVALACDNCSGNYKAKINFISPNAEFTPPVIFSKDNRSKLVYKVEAKINLEGMRKLHPGQPVDVMIKKSIKH